MLGFYLIVLVLPINGFSVNKTTVEYQYTNATETQQESTEASVIFSYILIGLFFSLFACFLLWCVSSVIIHICFKPRNEVPEPHVVSTVDINRYNTPDTIFIKTSSI